MRPGREYPAAACALPGAAWKVLAAHRGYSLESGSVPGPGTVRDLGNVVRRLVILGRDAARAAYAEEFIERLEEGYDTVVGERGFLRRAIAEDRVPSMVLWGPPGSGKSTLAGRLGAELTGIEFEKQHIDDYKYAGLSFKRSAHLRH